MVRGRGGAGADPVVGGLYGDVGVVRRGARRSHRRRSCVDGRLECRGPAVPRWLQEGRRRDRARAGRETSRRFRGGELRAVRYDDPERRRLRYGVWFQRTQCPRSAVERPAGDADCRAACPRSAVGRARPGGGGVRDSSNALRCQGTGASVSERTNAFAPRDAVGVCSPMHPDALRCKGIEASRESTCMTLDDPMPSYKEHSISGKKNTDKQ